MGAKPLPPQALLRQLLDYNPDTGALTWKWQESCDAFESEWAKDRFNDNVAGSPAICGRSTIGYLKGQIRGQSVYAHRVIWKLVHGYDPATIDHINGDRSDNRISNLRDVEFATNMRNTASRPGQNVVHQGVYWEPDRKKWRAEIGGGSRNHKKRLGRFSTKDEAIKARKEAEQALGYHENHGKRQSAYSR